MSNFAKEGYLVRYQYGCVGQNYIKDEGARIFGGIGVDFDEKDTPNPSISPELSKVYRDNDVDGMWVDSKLNNNICNLYEAKTQLKTFNTLNNYSFEVFANNKYENGKYQLNTGVKGSALRSRADWLCCINFVGKYEQTTGNKAGWLVDWNNPLYHPEYWLLIKLNDLRQYFSICQHELESWLNGRTQGYTFTLAELEQNKHDIEFYKVPFNPEYDFESLAKNIWQNMQKQG